MKPYVLLLALWLGSIQNPTTAEGTIEGRVLRSGSREPIPNTPVTLISSTGLPDEALTALLEQISQLVTIGLQGGGGGGSQDGTIRAVQNVLQSAGPGVGTQASVLTDRMGHFVFTNIPKGRYTVWVQRFNYFGPLLNGVPASTTSVNVVVDPPRPVPPVDLLLTQGLAISGRVLDGRGQPVLGMGATAYRLTYRDGTPLWAPVLGRGIDDRGEYRLSPLPAGEYYVGVTPGQNPLVQPAQARQEASIRTFFPGVAEPAQATKLVLKGNDNTGVDFTLRTAPSTLYKISGVALNPAAVLAADGTVDRGFPAFLLVPTETNLIDSFTPGTYANVAPLERRAAGEFEIRNVRPGTYELYPQFNYSGFLAGRTIVDVRTTDAPGVRVLVSPTVTLEGRVVLAEGTPQRPVPLEMVRVALKAVNAPSVRGSGPVKAPVNQSGQFVLSGPAGTLTTIQVSGLPETAFVSDVRMGNSSVYDTGFELTAPSESLQVVIDATRGGAVETTVRAAAGRPAPRATVVLVPAEDRRQNVMRYKIGTADNEGRLMLRGVPPGQYTAFAWESVPETAWQNSEFRSRYQDRATPITVAPAAQMNLQLSWIPFDADLR